MRVNMTHIVVAHLMAFASLGGVALAQAHSRVVLFDFEAGSEGWWGNPYGGGKCGTEVSDDAPLGSKSLRGWYQDVAKGANVVGPFLPEDAAWRKGEWDRVSFWFKGDGSASDVRFSVDAGQESGGSFSVHVPLDSTEWRRFTFLATRFWNREGRKLALRNAKRVLFGGGGTKSFLVDQISFESPRRDVPLDGPAAQSFSLSLGEKATGDYILRLDPAIPLRQKTMAALSVGLVSPSGERTSARRDITFGKGQPDEIEIPLRAAMRREGEARLSVALADKDTGASLGSGEYGFRVFLPVTRTRQPLTLCPQPKEMTLGRGEFKLDATTKLLTVGTETAEMDWCSDMLRDRLAQWHGLKLKAERWQGVAAPTDGIVLALGGQTALLTGDLEKRLSSLGSEGYVLEATPSRILLKSRGLRGLYNGCHTLLQVVRECTDWPGEPKTKAMAVVDWPSLPVRAATLGVPTNRWGHPNNAPLDPAFFNEFLFNCVARLKLNTIVLVISGGIESKKRPELAGPAAWTHEQVRQVLDFAKRNFIEVIPCVNSLGHANWLVLYHKDLQEDGDHQTLCTGNPKSRQIIGEVYDELVDLFGCKTFHIGMDEVRWQTHVTPEEKRCKLCAGRDKAEVFAEQVQWLHGHMKKRGVRTMMWGDQLLYAHNGGPPYATRRAIDRIPRDVIIANWSVAVDGDSSRYFRSKGFSEVIQSNSMGVTREQARHVMGNMAGLWTKTPWLAEHYDHAAVGHSYLTLVQNAEYSWNLCDDVQYAFPRLSPALLEERAGSVLRQMAEQPEPNAGRSQKPVDLRPACNRSTTAWFGLTADDALRHLPKGEVRFAGVRFTLPGSEGDAGRNCIVAGFPEPTAAATIPFSGRAASLCFLHTAHIEPSQRQGFNKRYEAKSA
ncbi:MAG: hypothetical protein FJ278_09055, partial [Planctomycetes bacterium]|nr:hypothetical protein [Planctomycetota bacterium]